MNTTTALRASGADLLFADLRVSDLVRTILELLHYILSNHFCTSGSTCAMQASDELDLEEHDSIVIRRFSL